MTIDPDIILNDHKGWGSAKIPDIRGPEGSVHLQHLGFAQRVNFTLIIIM